MCIESHIKIKGKFILLSVLGIIFSVAVILGGMFYHLAWWLLLMTIPMNILSYTAISRRDKIQISISRGGIFFRPWRNVIEWADIRQVVIDEQYLRLYIENTDKYYRNLHFFVRVMWKIELSMWGLAIDTEDLEHDISQLAGCIRRLHPDIPVVNLPEIRV